MAASRPAASDPGSGASPTHWKQLRIEGTLGRGSRGTVFHAVEELLGRPVALKLQPEHPGHSGDIEEARRLNQVRHPNVVQVYGADHADGFLGLWMELLEGRTVEDRIQAQGTMGHEEALLLARDLSGALAAVHRAGLVHGDVKAQNVFREVGGRTVLMDFGASRPSPGFGISSGRLQASPLYAAPEVLEGIPPDARADIYSLGVLIFYVISGGFPCDAGSLDELRRNQRAGRYRHLRDLRPDLPPAFGRFVEKAIDPNPERRFQTAGALEAEVSALLGAPRIEAPATVHGGVPGVEAPPATSRARPVLLAIGALVAIGLLVAALLAAQSFRVEAALFRREGRADVPLDPGARVRPGDQLVLRFAGSRPLFVYVFDLDDSNRVDVLFPRPGLDHANPVPGGKSLELPGPVQGKSMAWTVSAVGGHETISIVASPHRLPEVEEAIALLPGAEIFREHTGGPAASPGAAVLRSISRISAALPPEPAGSVDNARRLTDLMHLLNAGQERARGRWIRSIRLVNSG